MAELFYLTSALEFSGGTNVQTPVGHKIYEIAAKPLSQGKKFDGEDHGLYGLLKEYLDRGYENGWTNLVSVINMIPGDTHKPNTEYKNLATQYGEIIIENIWGFEKTYINTLTSTSQDCQMMYKWIINLLSEQVKPS